MNSTSTIKARLMLGAGSALIMSLAATSAHAQAVTIAGDVQTVIDGALVTDQTSQGNVTSTSTGAQISTNQGNGSVTASTLNVDNNRVGASASGNVDTLIFSDTGSANTSTGVAAAGRQVTTGTRDSNNVPITVTQIKATSSNNFIELRTGAANQSNLSVKNNTDAATAAGNTLAQSLTLDSANLTFGNGNAAGTATSTLTLDGRVMTASLQDNKDAVVEAMVVPSGAELFVSSSATDSSLALTGNTQSASATGSSAANGIALTGVNLGTGVASSSVQNNTATSVTAGAEGSSGVYTNDTLSNSSQALTGNRLQSQATGATSANTLSLTGTEATLPSAAVAPAANVMFEPTTLAPSVVSAAYATQNAQALLDGSDVTATTKGIYGNRAYGNDVAGNVSASAVATDSNIISAKAQGAVTSNATTLSMGAALGAGALGSGSTAANVAEGVAIGSLQTVSNDADVRAKVETVQGGSQTELGSNLLQNYMGGTLTSSSLSASNNLVQATAEATNATNALTASATSLSTAGDPLGVAKTTASTTGVTADAAFAVANVQRTGTGTVSATIQPTFNGTVENNLQAAVSGSSVIANGNQFAGFAVADKAANTLSVSGTTVTTDTALVNAQSSGADVKADLGSAGQTGGNVGVSTILWGATTDSTVAINGNSALGSSINNSAANTLAISATSLSGTGTDARAKITQGITKADNSLTNLQFLDSDSSSVTNVYGGFALEQGSGAITDSKLSVSNNTQFAESLGNSATNRLSSTATDMGAGITPTAALSNVQEGYTAITSRSNLSAEASAASTGSSIAISGNSNTALGVVNNGSNTLTVSGTNIANRGSELGRAVGSSLDGDYALANEQIAASSVESTATTQLSNVEFGVYQANQIGNNPVAANAATGVKDGSVALNGNATTAEGSGNRVANQLSVVAVAANGASAVLGNVQSNYAGVTSAAQTTVNYRLEPLTGVSADASMVSIDGNSTTALARGNTANNTLNYSAGAQYTGATTAASVVTGNYAQAQASLANAQSNDGDIAATSTSTTYSMVLNGGPISSAALNSSASVSGNSTAALAYGNTAVNSLTMATFAQGVPSSAVSSYQTNSGSVSATATTAGYNASFSGTVANSAVRNTGNSVTAQAVGNSSISTIGG
jgi:hypothetical protein